MKDMKHRQKRSKINGEKDGKKHDYLREARLEKDKSKSGKKKLLYLYL